MAKPQDITKSLGTSGFWIILVFGALMGLAYLGVWSYNNNSIGGIAVSMILFSMIIIGVILSKLEIFSWGSWNANCISFVVGLVTFIIVGSMSYQSRQPLFSITANPLLETIASKLPLFFEFVITVFVTPIAEELFWLVAIPIVTITLMNLAGAKYSFFRNIWFQLLVVTGISGITFALFHVGVTLFAALVAAFIFRAIMIVSVYGEMKLNIFPHIALVGSFAVGSHIGNNWGVFGLYNGLGLLISNDSNQIVGWLILAFLIIVFLTTLNALAQVFFRNKSPIKALN